MNPNPNQIKAIYQMLFEMATGNLSFRISESNENSELNKIAKTLNTLSQELKTIILKVGFINPHYSYQNLVQNCFLLNENFEIISFSPTVIDMLNYTEENLHKLDFEKVLTTQSVAVWELCKKELKVNQKYHNTIHLTFKSNQNEVVPAFCSVTKLMLSNKILISNVATILFDITSDRANMTPKKTDAVIIQEVYEYIMAHLEEPLPTLKDLSKLFGTNEFKLKDGFKHFFKTSIYKFYTEERLKQAHQLIQQTNLPLKEIAFMSGFNDYNNFSKAFKKQYHYPPSELKRNED